MHEIKDSENRRILIPFTEQEGIAIVQSGHYLIAAFGTGGAALIWNDGEPMPGCVKYLKYLRGELSENMRGAGI